MHAPESKKSPTGEQRSRSTEATRLLAAALVPLGLLASAGVEAGTAGFDPTRASRVDGTVNPAGDDFLYEFTVHNTSLPGEDPSGNPIRSTDQIVDWELPFFSAQDIKDGSIKSPDGWVHEILMRLPGPGGQYESSTYFNNGDPNQAYGDYTWDYKAADDPLLVSNPGLYGPDPGAFDEAPFILHWFTPCIDFRDENVNVPAAVSENTCDFEFIRPLRPINTGDALDGFSFVSAFNDQNAPYLASWFREPPTSGDPPIPENPAGFGTPNSPARMLAQGISASVPAPGTALLLGAGLVAFGLGRRALIA